MSHGPEAATQRLSRMGQPLRADFSGWSPGDYSQASIAASYLRPTLGVECVDLIVERFNSVSQDPSSPLSRRIAFF